MNEKILQNGSNLSSLSTKTSFFLFSFNHIFHFAEDLTFQNILRETKHKPGISLMWNLHQCYLPVAALNLIFLNVGKTL